MLGVVSSDCAGRCQLEPDHDPDTVARRRWIRRRSGSRTRRRTALPPAPACDGSNSMATLTVWKFDNWHEADQAVSTLEALARQQLIKVHDSATVSWHPETRRPKTRQLRNLVGPGAVGGMFWGMLFGLIFLMPVLGAAIGAATGAVAGSLRDVGIDDDLIQAARDRIVPGTSALFLLSSDAVQDKVKAAFDRTGLKAQLIESNLSNEQEAALREMFAG